MESEFFEDEPDTDEEAVIAPPPVAIPRQWSWSTETLLWAALGVLVLGFLVWFLMAYTGAKSRALVEAANNGAGGDDN